MEMIYSWVLVRKDSARTHESGYREDRETRKWVSDRQRELRRGNISTGVEARRCALAAGGKRYFADVAEKPATTDRKGVIGRLLQLLVIRGWDIDIPSDVGRWRLWSDGDISSMLSALAKKSAGGRKGAWTDKPAAANPISDRPSGTRASHGVYQYIIWWAVSNLNK